MPQRRSAAAGRTFAPAAAPCARRRPGPGSRARCSSRPVCALAPSPRGPGPCSARPAPRGLRPAASAGPAAAWTPARSARPRGRAPGAAAARPPPGCGCPCGARRAAASTAPGAPWPPAERRCACRASTAPRAPGPTGAAPGWTGSPLCSARGPRAPRRARRAHAAQCRPGPPAGGCPPPSWDPGGSQLLGPSTSMECCPAIPDATEAPSPGLQPWDRPSQHAGKGDSCTGLRAPVT
mmetsp:Transcript_41118/g.124636  ORF Transcript_41118/g.124636 Transcript_41118/m.124636 type:complete len:237 (-) Transcript_41118:9-719(-)